MILKIHIEIIRHLAGMGDSHTVHHCDALVNASIIAEQIERHAFVSQLTSSLNIWSS